MVQHGVVPCAVVSYGGMARIDWERLGFGWLRLPKRVNGGYSNQKGLRKR